MQILQAKLPWGTLLPLSIDKELTSADFALEVLKVHIYVYTVVCESFNGNKVLWVRSTVKIKHMKLFHADY